MSGDPTTVFVYGTLTDPDRVDDVLDDWSFGPNATLRGAHRAEGRYPTLLPGGETDGRLLRTPELDVLDDYEGVDRGLYVRVAVPRGEEPDEGAPERDRRVEVYAGDPSELGLSVRADGLDDLPSLDALAGAIAAGCRVISTPE